MYSVIPDKQKQELKDICEITDKSVSLSKTKESTSYFAFHSLGLNPRLWQHTLWNALDYSAKRIACVTSRQIGKSTSVAIYALKVAAYNLRPKGFNKKTHVGIISATDEQSKKIMLEIRRLIHMGDENVSKRTSGKIEKFYTKMIDSSQAASNNKTAITFKNGNQIICLPPTPRIRGYSFSYVFVDEAAFIIDDNVFFEYIEPTTANTDGIIVLTSTPNGQQGWFFDLFDPENKREHNEYKRFWIHYTSVEDEDFQKSMHSKKKTYLETGREKEWEQEYDALFTSQTTAFFENEDVDKGISPEIMRLDSYKGECDMGVDFGMVHSKTVITISAMIENKSTLIYDYEYKNTDETLLEDLDVLCSKFNVQRIVCDDCPEGHYIIQELIRKGKNVTKMNFRSEKITKYMAFRKALKQEKIKYYKNTQLTAQLKSLQQIEGPTSTKIEKPSGGRDDYPDSFLLSCYHLIEEEDDFDTAIVLARKRNPVEFGLYQSDEWKMWNKLQGGKE
jgi:hypothetical protein